MKNQNRQMKNCGTMRMPIRRCDLKEEAILVYLETSALGEDSSREGDRERDLLLYFSCYLSYNSPVSAYIQGSGPELTNRFTKEGPQA